MKFIGTLCQRLLQCGISPNQITVLALYDAQKKAIENFISKSVSYIIFTNFLLLFLVILLASYFYAYY